MTSGLHSSVNTALVAISADALTRENVFDAIFSRRAYATTGDRILLEVRFGEAGMGEEVSGPATPVLNVEVEGTAPVVAVEVWKDVAPVHKLEANAESVRLEWTDPNPPAGWHYPGCVGYGEEELNSFLAEAGLEGCALPWFHPGATWHLAVRTGATRPSPDDLAHLTGKVLDGR